MCNVAITNPFSQVIRHLISSFAIFVIYTYLYLLYMPKLTAIKLVWGYTYVTLSTFWQFWNSSPLLPLHHALLFVDTPPP